MVPRRKVNASSAEASIRNWLTALSTGQHEAVTENAEQCQGDARRTAFQACFYEIHRTRRNCR